MLRFASPIAISLLLALPLLIPSLAGADRAQATNAHLPSPAIGTSAIWTGTFSYIFGGVDFDKRTATDVISRFDPATGQINVMNAKLPFPAGRTVAAWDGVHAYIFGLEPSFCNFCSPQDPFIVRYDPATDSLTTMNSRLPADTANSLGGAVWDGQKFWIVGANSPRSIFTYEGPADVLHAVPTNLGTLRNPGVGFDGQNIYIFGGQDGTNGGTSTVYRLDRVTGNVSNLGVRFPGDWFLPTVWNGREFLIFGGVFNAGVVTAYNPTTHVLTRLDTALPGNPWDVSAIWANGAAWAFGGEAEKNCPGSCFLCGCQINATDAILRYSLEPSPPDPVAAAPNGPGSIVVKWDRSSPTSYLSPLTGYRVYRTGADDVRTLAGQVTADPASAAAGMVFTFTDRPPIFGAYSYTVSALNADGEGLDSGAATAVATPIVG